MFKRKVSVFILCLLIMFGFNMEVLAATTYKLKKPGPNIYFSSSGKYCASPCGGGYTVYKYFTIGGKKAPAYCTQLDNNLVHTEYVETTKWVNDHPMQAAIAGKAYHLAKDKWSGKEEYLYITLLMNCIVGMKLNDPSQSKNYCKKNDTLNKIVEEAKKNYSTAKFDGKFPEPKVVYSKALKATNVANKYVSEKITVSNLKQTYGGGDMSGGYGDVTYTFSVPSGSLICDDAAGTKNCNQSRRLDKPSASSVSFYITTNGNNGNNVKLNIKGSNTSIYYYVRLFKSTKGSSTNQKLIIPGTKTVPRPYNKDFDFEIDVSSNQIKITKVDGDDYEKLAGAELQLYKASKDGDSDNFTKIGDNLNLVKTGDYSFTYSSNESIFSPISNTFYYCMAETKAPSGYKLLKKPSCFPAEKKSTACYDENGEETDIKYCISSYSCPRDENNYELSDGRCNTTEEVDGTPVLGCPDGSDPDGDRCLASSPASVNPDTGELYCENGGNLSGENCISEFNKIPRDLICPTPTQDPTNTYTPIVESGKCIRTVGVNATCKDKDGNTVDGKYCSNSSNYTYVTPSGNSILVNFPNEKTKVSISKKAVSGEDELYGAELKICSTKPDANGNCEVVTMKEKGSKCPTIGDDPDAVEENDDTNTTNDTNNTGSDNNTNNTNSNENTTNNDSNGSNNSSDEDTCTYDEATDTRTIKLDWISSDVPKTWSGLETGKTYYLVEVLPPLGYVPITTSIEFVINEDGSIKAGDKDVPEGLVVVNNQLTDITISKTDIATSKEIPGAVLSICAAAFDDDNNLVMIKNSNDECAVANLADGSEATWVSGKEPHKISGLPIGAYYLVEKLAPNGYSTAESIPFILTKEGILTDIKGNNLADNKLVMHDKPLRDVKTGSLGTYIIALLLVLAVVGGAGSYYFLKKQGDQIA